MKEPKPEKHKPKLFTNGVALEVPCDAGHRDSKPKDVCVRPFTSLTTAQEISKVVSGTSDAIVVHTSPYVCQHTMDSFMASMACFMDMDPFVRAIVQTQMFEVAWLLLTHDLQQATIKLLGIMSQAARSGSLKEGLSLRIADDNVAMYYNLHHGDFLQER